MHFLFYSFLLFIGLVPLVHPVFLTVNEEFFVFASFFIFIDLFGHLFANLVSEALAPTQGQLIRRFRAAMETELFMLAQLQIVYNNLTQLVAATRNIRLGFYEELHGLISQRRMDKRMCNLHILNTVERATIQYESEIDRFVAYLNSSNELGELKSALVSAANTSSAIIKLTLDAQFFCNYEDLLQNNY